MKSKMPQPIPYQGSKRFLASEILKYYPVRFNRLIEPFAGSAAISVAAAYSNRTNLFWINDKNKPLIELLNLIIEEPEFIIKKYSKIWNEQLDDPRNYYNHIRNIFNETHKPEYLLYLLARCVKAAVRYNSRGEFNQSPDHRRLGRKPKGMASEIIAISALLKGKAVFTSIDYNDILGQINENDFIYMDPPYQGTTNSSDSRYLSGVPTEEFIVFIRELTHRKIPFIISYDGVSGDREYGKELPKSLGLKRILVNAGKSTQATLIGKKYLTMESLYLSPEILNLQEEYKVIEQLALSI